MNIYRSFQEIERDQDTVLTVGTFDGVHKGHLKIIRRLQEISRDNNLRHIVITLYPHPQVVLSKKNKPKINILTSIEERLHRFETIGVENTFVMPFTVEFSRTSPEDFVRKYLWEKIGMRIILIGYDHLFGKNREGNENLLSNIGKELGFSIEKVPPYVEDNEIISSSKIRKAVLNRDLETANRMLNYYYFLCGRVVRGDARGKKLGFPTANIKSSEPNKLMPANGVYFVYSVIEGKTVFGMANIGRRPTFTNDENSTLEVNYFDFDKDIYEENICVHFIKYIRPEKKFDGVQSFLAQLEKDKKLCMREIECFHF